jgi:hypothetical protein
MIDAVRSPPVRRDRELIDAISVSERASSLAIVHASSSAIRFLEPDTFAPVPYIARFDAPERLLFMTKTEPKKFSGIKASLGEIMRYRMRFLPE